MTDDLLRLVPLAIASVMATMLAHREGGFVLSVLVACTSALALLRVFLRMGVCP